MNAQGQFTPDAATPMLNNAATKWGVPLPILAGVFGIETDFGKNIATSSAGAQGTMQFLPSTASRYGYPLTNSPTMAQAQQQFDAAAHYLSDLKKQTGSWDAAIQHYSGGGYSLAQVQQKAGQKVGANEAVAGGINIANPLNSVASAITDVFNQAVSDLKYASVLVVVLFAAGYLMVHGLGGSSNGKTRHVPVPV